MELKDSLLQIDIHVKPSNKKYCFHYKVVTQTMNKLGNAFQEFAQPTWPETRSFYSNPKMNSNNKNSFLYLSLVINHHNGLQKLNHILE